MATWLRLDNVEIDTDKLIAVSWRKISFKDYGQREHTRDDRRSSRQDSNAVRLHMAGKEAVTLEGVHCDLYKEWHCKQKTIGVVTEMEEPTGITKVVTVTKPIPNQAIQDALKNANLRAFANDLKLKAEQNISYISECSKVSFKGDIAIFTLKLSTGETLTVAVKKKREAKL